MNVPLALLLDLELFDLQEAERAVALARESNSEIYTWKTVGTANWLEEGISRADTLGLVVLPCGLPALIEMPDDALEEDDPAQKSG